MRQAESWLELLVDSMTGPREQKETRGKHRFVRFGEEDEMKEAAV